jgi:hypothetical protein
MEPSSPGAEHVLTSLPLDPDVGQLNNLRPLYTTTFQHYNPIYS